MITVRTILRRTVASSTAFALLAIAAWVVMSELDRLVSAVVTPSGVAHRLSGIMSPGAFADPDAWGDWTAGEFPAPAVVFAHTIADLVFIGCYTVLLVRLLRWCAGPGVRLPRWGVGLVAAFALSDVLEDVMLLKLSLGAEAPTWLVWTQIGATLLKWLAAAALIAYLLLSSSVGDPVRRAVRAGWHGLYAQRLVAIVVAAIALVSLASADGVLEQLPDVYRGWFGYDDALDGGAIIASFLAFLITATGLLWLTRGRARRYAFDRPPLEPRPALAPWVGSTLVTALVGIGVGAFNGQTGVDWVPLLVFLVVLVLIVGISWAVRALERKPSRDALPDPILEYRGGDDAADRARRTGDLLVAFWVALAGLGPFKALVAPIALDATGAFDTTQFEGSAAWTTVAACAFLVVGVGAAIVTRHLTAKDPGSTSGGRPVHDTLQTALVAGEVDDAQQRRLDVLGYVVLGVSGAVILTFLLIPMGAGAFVGPAAAIVLLAGAWIGVLGWLTLALGHRRPLEVFQLLRLRSAPVIALMLVLPTIAASISNAPSLHAVRFDAPGPLPDRTALAAAYDQWYASDTCAVERDGRWVKPLVLVAAEGGGIRAATWTVDVLRELAKTTDAADACSSRAVLLSSGASGGSIGLATFREEGNARGAHEQTTIDYSGTHALSADLVGLLAGDIVGAVTGIRVPSSGIPHEDGWEWRDRTAMQEATWESQAPQFAEPYDASLVHPTGYLVLNSTDATSLCKVVISQLDLTDGVAESVAGDLAVTPDCTGADAELANTIDLIDYLGPCRGNLTWGTAAELSARFPFVSPGGRISSATLPAGCDKVADLQLVDGGNTDNSAIGTLVDIAPALTAAIRRDNAREGAGSADRPFVVPLVLFATNEPGSDVVTTPDPARPEAFVPFSSMFGAKEALVSPAAWLQRAVDVYAEVCPALDDACTRARDAIHAVATEGAVVASPTTEPAVSVPLGWALSEHARSRLRADATGQALCGRGPGSADARQLEEYDTNDDGTIGDDGDPGDAACRASGPYGDLGALLRLFDAATPRAVSD